jgi:translation initiation factor IF-1
MLPQGVLESYVYWYLLGRIEYLIQYQYERAEIARSSIDGKIRRNRLWNRDVDVVIQQPLFGDKIKGGILMEIDMR